jgi:D-proline reductase (dithiol) PrdB
MGWMQRTKLWRRGGGLWQSGLGAGLLYRTGGAVNRVGGVLTKKRPPRPVAWSPMEQPLSRSVLALVTTAGLHHRTDLPFDVHAGAGDPSYREFPSNVDPSQLTISHTRYPHRYFNRDTNVVLPLDCLRRLETFGVVRLAPRFFSFGFTGRLTRELIHPHEGSAHLLVRELFEDKVDVVVMVPAGPSCTRAGALIARVLEEAGITTVCLSINREVSERIGAPRTVCVKFPPGAPFGRPGVPNARMRVLRASLRLAQEAEKPGVIEELDYQWRRTDYRDVAPSSFVAPGFVDWS